ncbi:MAG: penicillin-binding transpeptidase domain-containing protein [Pseudomonadota bacterium]
MDKKALWNRFFIVPLPDKKRLRPVPFLVMLITALMVLSPGPSKVQAVYSPDAEPSGSAQKNKDFPRTDIYGLFGERFFYQAAAPASFSKNTSDGQVTVYTTIREDVQQKMTALFKRYSPLIAAGVVLDAKTGAVLAMANYTNGGAGRSLLPAGEDNYCLYGGIPAASLIKIITAAGALEKKGFANSQTLPVSGRYHTLYKSQVGIEKSRYRGEPVSLEKAFALSINPFFAKIGIEYLNDTEFNQIAEGFLFNRPLEFDLPVSQSRIITPVSDFERAEVASGYNTRTTVSPLHAAMIASLPANDGKIMRPFIVERIVSAGGEELYSKQIKTIAQPLSSHSVENLGLLMQGTVHSGTAKNGFSHIKQYPAAQDWIMGGKTGSIDLPGHTGRCDWFAGFGQDGDTRLAISFILIHGAKKTVRSTYVGAETLRSCFIRGPAAQGLPRPEEQAVKKSLKHAAHQAVKPPVQEQKKRPGKHIAKKAMKSWGRETGG